MSDIDLSAAIRAARRSAQLFDHEAEQAVNAAAPLIEAAVREQIAARIANLIDTLDHDDLFMRSDGGEDAYLDGLERAIAVVEGS